MSLYRRVVLNDSPDRYIQLVDLCPDAKERLEAGKRRREAREAEYNSEKQVAVRARRKEYSRKYRLEKKRQRSWAWRLIRILGGNRATQR